MRFYVKVDDEYYTNFFSEDRAKWFCEKFVSDDTVSYLEYGVINYDGWVGLSSIAVLKSGKKEAGD